MLPEPALNRTTSPAHNQKPAPPPPSDTSRPLANAEGRILRLGILLGFVYLASLVLAWIIFPQHAPLFGAMTAMNVLVGRAAGMSFGYAAGLGHHLVIPANMLIESIQVLIVFPLFVLSWRHLLEIRALQSFMKRMEAAAEARRAFLRRYGMVGLFIFVLIPFWMTGPVVGAIMGFLIGLRPWINMSVVLGATYIAIGLWAFLLHGISSWASAYNQYAPFGLVAAIILIITLAKFLHRNTHPPGPA